VATGLIPHTQTILYLVQVPFNLFKVAGNPEITKTIKEFWVFFKLQLQSPDGSTNTSQWQST